MSELVIEEWGLNGKSASVFVTFIFNLKISNYDERSPFRFLRF